MMKSNNDLSKQIEEFYESPLGKELSAHVVEFINEIWPSMKDCLIQNQTILGIGVTKPYLSYFSKNNLVFNLILTKELSNDQRGEIFLQDEKIPLGDDSVDKILIAHAFENQENIEILLKEIWRILKPSGRAIFIVPNRISLVRRGSTLPIFFGKSFGLIELNSLLKEHMFDVKLCQSSFNFMPSCYKFFPEILIKFDKITTRYFNFFGGLIYVEVEKNLINDMKETSQTKKSTKQYASILMNRKIEK